MRNILISILTAFLTIATITMVDAHFPMTISKNFLFTHDNNKPNYISEKEKLDLTMNYIDLYYSYQKNKLIFETKFKCLNSGCVSYLELTMLRIELEKEKHKLILVQNRIKNTSAFLPNLSAEI